MSAITKIKPGSFAAACYEQNTLSDLRSIVDGPAECYDMENWQITPDEWTAQVKLAIAGLEEKLSLEEA